MKTIIAGCRHFIDYEKFSEEIVKVPWPITSVVCGKAKGADTLGEHWAKVNKLSIDEYPADWELYNRGAGNIRNNQMAKNAEALVAFWDGKSFGTKNMISQAVNYGLEVCVVRI